MSPIERLLVSQFLDSLEVRIHPDNNREVYIVPETMNMDQPQRARRAATALGTGLSTRDRKAGAVQSMGQIPDGVEGVDVKQKTATQAEMAQVILVMQRLVLDTDVFGNSWWHDPKWDIRYRHGVSAHELEDLVLLEVRRGFVRDGDNGLVWTELS